MEELVEKIARFGGAFVFFNVLLEQLGLPIPAYPALIVTGALAAQGRLPWSQALLAPLAACLLADSFWFLLGRRHGASILKAVCRISLSPDTCVRQTEGFFERWGLRSLLVSKFIPGLNMVAAPLTGSQRTFYPAFFVHDLGGAALWAWTGVAIGALFRNTVGDVLAALASLGNRAPAVLAIAFGGFVLVKWWRRFTLIRLLRGTRITVDELGEMMKSDQRPLVVDVRSKGARTGDPRRIPGAVIVSVPELDAHVAHLPRDAELILYCT